MKSLTLITGLVLTASLSFPLQAQTDMKQKGFEQVARLWQPQDGTREEMEQFCRENYISDPTEREKVFQRISYYLESIFGYYGAMSVRLDWNVTIDNGPLLPIDSRFAAYSPSAHFSEDFYHNKLAFYIALNFPQLSLAEKEALDNNRLAWAYARLGDTFTGRMPASIRQRSAQVNSDAEMYVAAYNIYMGHLTDRKGKKLFPENMILLSHWNLRDEIKANYNKGKEGLEKQRMVYEVMKRIIDQTIPKEVINSGAYDWNPFSNTITAQGKPADATPEAGERYQKMLNNFNLMQEIDSYSGHTFIDRNFNHGMEVGVDEAIALFHNFMSAPELKEVGKLIRKRLGRNLEAYDIWYDGFKLRSNLNEEKLSEQTRARYPDAAALEKDLPNILVKLGFDRQRADYLASKIAVDPARGSGHALGSPMIGEKSRLRTRIPAGGLDYKGFNIAIHEFGHNVEQTLSLYDIDYTMLSGVPNTSFTEALAFMFQARDLLVLDISDDNPEKDDMNLLDKIWSLYEICGVSMVDISVWQWLYANPNATATQLRDAAINIARAVWNTYYEPVFGTRDETILAVYSHIISYPLYLSAYAFGQIIEFQLESYMQGKNFATEVDRIYRLGRLTPARWMMEATGTPLSVDPMLTRLREVLKKK
ncbi:MAG: hypothetical protein LBN06_01840 [Prevotellaceae bacterium]|jgi:hypothetical protein|nr:hypothetical protein [Prevotellaceae bacterium]